MQVPDMLTGSVADVAPTQVASGASSMPVRQQKTNLAFVVAYGKLHGFKQIRIARPGGDYVSDIGTAGCLKNGLVVKIHQWLQVI